MKKDLITLIIISTISIILTVCMASGLMSIASKAYADSQHQKLNQLLTKNRC